MTFHLKESPEQHTSLLSSFLTSTSSEHSLLLVTEEGWLLPTSRLLLTLHSPLLAPLLSSSSSSLSIPAPASTLSSLLTTLSTGSSSPSSMAEVREVQELATTLGIPLTNTAAELQRKREMKTIITFNPDPLVTKMEHLEKKPKTKKKAGRPRKETPPANLEAFANREEGLGQWSGVENGEQHETRVKEEIMADSMPMEVVLVPEPLTETSIEQMACEESSLFTQEFDPTNHLTTDVDPNSQPEEPAPTAVEVAEEWPCDMCPKKFAKEVFLESHKTNRHEGTAFTGAIQEWPCSDCPKKFSGEEHLTKHKARLHKKVEKGIYACGNCRQSFNTVPEHNEHKTSVHMGKCEACGMELLKSGLKKHMKIKHSELSEQVEV